MKRDFILNRIIKVMLLVLSMTVGQNALAESTWEVTNENGSSNTFIIKRSEKGYEQTVHFRTISLSAYAGQHFTAVDMDYTFPANEDTKTVTVSESTPSGAYAYQTATSRKYGFEVTDRGGFRLAYAERSKTWGTSVTGSGVFSVKDVTIHSGEVTVTDGGYAQSSNPYTINSSSYYNAGTQAYLSFLNAQLRMTLNFQAKEKSDGYQYVQILVNNTTDCDTGAGDGNPGTISLSCYMAGFTIGGKGVDTYYNYSFPVTTVGNDAGATKPWTGINNTVADLEKQKFNTSCRATDGKLIIPTNFTTLVVRLNASGSDNDDWYAKNIKANIIAVDATAPTKSAVSVNPGRHAKGNTVYVSVAFSEIVTVTGTPTLSTTSDNHWGSLSYVAGSGTNVLTFSTTIPQDATGALNITGLSGTVKDLAGNSLAGGTVTANSLCTLDASYAYSISYELDGGTMATENLATYTYETATFTLNNPTRTGYTFDGWTGSNGNTPQTTVTIAAGSYDNKSYTANWTVNTYTISYDGLDGASFQTDKNSFTIESSAITLDTPTKTGYTFDGWTGSNGNTPATEVTIAAGSYDNKSYTANWTVNTYTISYDGLDGASFQTDKNSFTIESSAITLDTPTKTGYTFDGWTGSNGNTPATEVTIAAGSYDNKSYTANWTVNTYTVTLDNQGATTEGTAEVTATYGAAMPAISVPAKTGYMFWGYYTGTDGGGTKYYNADGTSAHDWDIDAATILYAWWTVVTYIDADGNEQTCTEATLLEGSSEQFSNYGADGQENWYVVYGDITYSGRLRFNDSHSHIILCDGATLSVSSIHEAIYGNKGSITIYGQSQQSGAITASGGRGGGGGIRANGPVTINGGSVTASGTTGIITDYNITVNRGSVSATGNYIGISGNYVTINGGIVNATGARDGISADCNITLGWSDASDRITASSYACSTLAVKAGQAFYDGADYYTGTLSTDQINAMTGKTLLPAVTYIDENGQEQSKNLSDVTIIESSDGNVELGNNDNVERWYAVSGNVTINGQLKFIDKNIHLILCDGASLTVNCATMHAIYTPWGDLTIYGQSAQSGTVNATSNSSHGINGSHNITINGGTVNATSNSTSAIYSLDDVIINGGTVTASGYYGINASDNVIINGGTVTAHCSNNYHAIYGYNNVTINGGIINADSPNKAIYACRGTLTLGWTNATDRITASSYYSKQGTVSVKAGQAFYDGNDYYTGTLSTDQINTMEGKTLQPAVTYSITLPEHVSASGTVTRLNGTTYAPAGVPVTLSTETGIILSSVTVNGTPATDNGDGTWSYSMPAQDVTVAATVTMPPVTYIDADGIEQSRTYYTLLTSDDDISNATNNQGYLPGGWYVVDGDIDCISLQFSGDVHIILADGARLYVNCGINSRYDLTIYGQAAGSGELSLRYPISCNNICINGGIINNYNGTYGIRANGNVTINGGTINIESSENTGIQANGNVTINGGTINIESSENTGIQANGNVTINGGTLSLPWLYLKGILARDVILASSTSLKTLNITRDFYVYTISLDRTFTVGKPATLMLPFYMDVNDISGGTFYTFGGVEKENDRWVATMNAVTDHIEPNTPYLVMPTETSLRFTDGTFLCTTGGGGGQTADEGSHWTFKGTYDYIKWTTDTSDPDYTAERAAEIGRVYGFAGVQKDGIEVGDFVKVASGARIRPMSAYLMWSDTPNAQNAPMRGSRRTGSAQELPQSITVRLLDASGTVTNVGEIDTVTGEISFEGWYTLQGVKLDAEPTEPGIYINNGKTVSIQK